MSSLIGQSGRGLPRQEGVHAALHQERHVPACRLQQVPQATRWMDLHI